MEAISPPFTSVRKPWIAGQTDAMATAARTSTDSHQLKLRVTPDRASKVVASGDARIQVPRV